MLRHSLALVLLICFVGAIGKLTTPPDKSYNVLMLLPYASRSHRNLFISLAEGLADRGHIVTMLTGHKNLQRHPNITEIYHGLDYLDIQSISGFESLKHKNYHRSQGLGSSVQRMAQDLYEIPIVMELYKKKEEFDLVVISYKYNEAALPFVHGKRFINIQAGGLHPLTSAILGNPLNPSYIPNIKGTVYDLSSFLGRLQNMISHISAGVYWRHWVVIPILQEEISMRFPDLPPLVEIERNLSLSLVNTHFSIDMAQPLLPSQIDVGGMQCRPAKPLPEELKSWLDEGRAGVIYFSLGSVTKGASLPVRYRNMLMEAFKRLEQRVLWKFEEDIEVVPDNVMIKQWLPQQDILGDANTKVFITHGGLLSSQEACYHGVPMLALPIYSDQPKNAARIVARGWGLSLEWEDMTADKIVEALLEIINNPKYREKIAEVSEVFKDQLQTPLERAVFWSEYVIRHQGAPNLSSPTADLSWVEFLLLDVIFILLLLVLVSFLFVLWLLRKTIYLMFNFDEKLKRKRKRD